MKSETINSAKGADSKMRTFRPKIEETGKSLAWIWKALSGPQRHSLKNLFDLDGEGELMMAIKLARKPNKVILEACRLLRVRLEKNAFSQSRSGSKNRGSSERPSARNGYGKFKSNFGRLSN